MATNLAIDDSLIEEAVTLGLSRRLCSNKARFKSDCFRGSEQRVDARGSRIKCDYKLVTLNLHLDISNSLKPYQGFFDLVRSGHSRSTAFALGETRKVESNSLKVSIRYLLRLRYRPSAAKHKQHSNTDGRV